MSIIFPILIFGFLILIHELGHFITAKLSGVKVEEFSIFMGPTIWKKQVGETTYVLGCIPIGGYCAMQGEDEGFDDPRSFQKAAWWKRMAILLAGSVVNLLGGFIIYACLFLPGEQVVVPEIREFTDCCIFNTEDGLHLGDEILEIDGEKVYTNNNISMLLNLNPTGVHDLVIRRGDKTLEFYDYAMTHTHLDENGVEYRHYGFGFGQEKEASFGDKLSYICNVMVDNVRMVRLSLQMLVTGRAGVQDMVGPVGIVSQMSTIAAESETVRIAVWNLLSVAAFLSINLGVMNLLPFPALDGGRALCLLLIGAAEKISGKKIDPKYEAYIHRVGMILLMTLMAVVMFKDIFVLFKR